MQINKKKTYSIFGVAGRVMNMIKNINATRQARQILN